MEYKKGILGRYAWNEYQAGIPVRQPIKEYQDGILGRITRNDRMEY